MTSFDTTQTSYGTSAHRAGSVFAHLFAAFSAWNDARKTSHALNALNERELADIGLTRGDIKNVANNHFIR